MQRTQREREIANLKAAMLCFQKECLCNKFSMPLAKSDYYLLCNLASSNRVVVVVVVCLHTDCDDEDKKSADYCRKERKTVIVC